MKVQSNCEVQLRLRELQSLDFSDLTNYAERFQELLESIGQRGGVVAPAAAGPRYNNAPPLPANFVDRPEILTALREALFEEVPNRNIALTTLQRMGGIGKTVLAQALCQQALVRHAYPDGIFWFTIGKESRRYCLSYTATVLTGLPSALVPVVVTVRVLPSLEITALPVIIALPPLMVASL